jgi:hypothetical protein
MERVIEFLTPEEADRRNREYYASLTPQERLESQAIDHVGFVPIGASSYDCWTPAAPAPDAEKASVRTNQRSG